MSHDLLHGYAAAALESAAAEGHLEAVRRDVEVFAAALTDSEPLRRVLTDPLVSDVARRGIVVDLLRGRGAVESGELIDFALRVVRPAELAVAIADLDAFGEEFLAGVEDAPTAGRAAVRARIRGYTERILEELSGLDEVDVVEDELFGFARIVEENPSLRRVLRDAGSPLEARQHVLADLLAAKVRPATLRLVSYVLRAGAVRDLVGTYEWLVDLAAEERNRRIAQVRAAVELSAEERSRLAGALSGLVHRDVEVRVIDDPSVIGGLLVSVGDLLIDGTVRLRFERLRDAIAQWA
jgi:F-type H+-transporting ATPase subunit delta